MLRLHSFNISSFSLVTFKSSAKNIHHIHENDWLLLESFRCRNISYSDFRLFRSVGCAKILNPHIITCLSQYCSSRIWRIFSRWQSYYYGEFCGFIVIRFCHGKLLDLRSSKKLFEFILIFFFEEESTENVMKKNLDFLWWAFARPLSYHVSRIYMTIIQRLWRWKFDRKQKKIHRYVAVEKLKEEIKIKQQKFN